MNKNTTLIVSNHYRRSLFFEKTMTRLYQNGYQHIWIQNTSGENPWGKYNGPYERFFDLGHRTYDQAMMTIKTKEIPSYIKTICFIDNDCFLEGSNVLDRYLTNFQRGQFDWASNHVARIDNENYSFQDSTLAECLSQKFEASTCPSGDAPNPHWENAFLLIKRDLWDQQTERDLSSSRRWIKRTHELGAKMGAHQTEYRLGYSHCGEGWFHIGNLMQYYSAIERNEFSKFNPESSLDMSRLGYFLAQQKNFSECCPYDSGLQNKIYGILEPLHDKAIIAWQDLVKGTFLERV